MEVSTQPAAYGAARNRRPPRCWGGWRTGRRPRAVGPGGGRSDRGLRRQAISEIRGTFPLTPRRYCARSASDHQLGAGPDRPCSSCSGSRAATSRCTSCAATAPASYEGCVCRDMSAAEATPSCSRYMIGAKIGCGYVAELGSMRITTRSTRWRRSISESSCWTSSSGSSSACVHLDARDPAIHAPRGAVSRRYSEEITMTASHLY